MWALQTRTHISLNAKKAATNSDNARNNNNNHADSMGSMVNTWHFGHHSFLVCLCTVWLKGNNLLPASSWLILICCIVYMSVDAREKNYSNLMVLPNWMTLNENQVEGMANERAYEGEKTTHKSGSLALENRINISIRNKSNLNITIDNVFTRHIRYLWEPIDRINIVPLNLNLILDWIFSIWTLWCGYHHPELNKKRTKKTKRNK